MCITSVLHLNGTVSLQYLRVFNSFLPQGRTLHEKFSSVYSESCESLVVKATVIFQSLTGFLNMPAETVRLLCCKQKSVDRTLPALLPDAEEATRWAAQSLTGAAPALHPQLVRCLAASASMDKEPSLYTPTSIC